MSLQITLHAPFDAVVHPTSDVPDKVFSQDMMGQGVALVPREEIVPVRAPLSGTVTTLWDHATILTPDDAPDGVGALLHLGVDTVRLQGEGFERLCARGDRLAAGDPLVRWDTTVAAARELPLIAPLVLLAQPGLRITMTTLVAPGEQVEAGQELLRYELEDETSD